MADLAAIVRLRLEGRFSLRAIGLEVGLSGERVRQILKNEGYDLGKIQKTKCKTRQPNATLNEALVLKVYGCSVDEFRSIQGHKALSNTKSQAFVYRQQRHKRMKQPGWIFTFPDWWSFWQLRWPERVALHLCLVPIDPTLPVGLGNAEIIPRSTMVRRNWRERELKSNSGGRHGSQA